MALAKHEFVDDYPYLVYTDVETCVYSDKADTSIDDIGGGGGEEWGDPVKVSLTSLDAELFFYILQSPDFPPSTYISIYLTGVGNPRVPAGLYCATVSEDPLSFTIDDVAFTDYTENTGVYVYQMPEGNDFKITVGLE